MNHEIALPLVFARKRCNRKRGAGLCFSAAVAHPLRTQHRRGDEANQLAKPMDAGVCEATETAPIN
jgi:hypothetical protein